MDIGKKIKVARAEKGWTQQDLADKVNRTRSLIGNIEQSGKGNPETLQEIAAVLGIDLSDPSAKKSLRLKNCKKKMRLLKRSCLIK
ncbi:MAG: helix-turn-helix domain-containing protein [Sphingobacteriales bacterium JAD_PAG50586_3]|nr:MAG: helix-turn-helix domain-containing protein [Sphingobacteriales bacterium JAD_PAG50586_3]